MYPIMKMILITLILSALLGSVLCAPANSCINRTTVSNLDLPRFMGRWYEIARYDHSFERNLTAVQTHYTLLPNGHIEVVNRGIDERTGKEKVARGKAHTTNTPGRLRVSFFWFFFSDYNVLALAPDYAWCVIGSRSSKYLWILSRTPQLPTTTLSEILHQIEERGYPTAPLLFIDQPNGASDQATEQTMPSATT